MKYSFYILLLLCEVALCLAMTPCRAQGLRRGGHVVRVAATRKVSSCALPVVYNFYTINNRGTISWIVDGSDVGANYDLYVNGVLIRTRIAAGTGGALTLGLSSYHGTLTVKGWNSCGTVVMSGSVVQ